MGMKEIERIVRNQSVLLSANAMGGGQKSSNGISNCVIIDIEDSMEGDLRAEPCVCATAGKPQNYHPPNIRKKLSKKGTILLLIYFLNSVDRNLFCTFCVYFLFFDLVQVIFPP